MHLALSQTKQLVVTLLRAVYFLGGPGTVVTDVITERLRAKEVNENQRNLVCTQNHQKALRKFSLRQRYSTEKGLSS